MREREREREREMESRDVLTSRGSQAFLFEGPEVSLSPLSSLSPYPLPLPVPSRLAGLPLRGRGGAAQAPAPAGGRARLRAVRQAARGVGPEVRSPLSPLSLSPYLPFLSLQPSYFHANLGGGPGGPCASPTAHLSHCTSFCSLYPRCDPTLLLPAPDASPSGRYVYCNSDEGDAMCVYSVGGERPAKVVAGAHHGQVRGSHRPFPGPFQALSRPFPGPFQALPRPYPGPTQALPRPLHAIPMPSLCPLPTLPSSYRGPFPALSRPCRRPHCLLSRPITAIKCLTVSYLALSPPSNANACGVALTGGTRCGDAAGGGRVLRPGAGDGFLR